jgi:hypothetical protein
MMKLQLAPCLAGAAWAAIAAAAAASEAAADAAPPAALRPYQASYDFEWRGMSAGTSSFTLQQDSNGEWTYISRNQPRGLFRLVPSASMTITSRISVGPDGVRPLHFTGTAAGETTPQGEVVFDWAANRAIGTVDGERIDMALRPGVQDDLSVQVALMHALASGQTPEGISLFDKKGIRDYAYTRVGEETLHTPVGDVPTIVYRSQRAHSPRSTRFWCAPQFGFVPMRAEQRREERVEWTMTLRSIHRE